MRGDSPPPPPKPIIQAAKFLQPDRVTLGGPQGFTGSYGEPVIVSHASIGSQKTLRTLQKHFSTRSQFLARFLVYITTSASCQPEF